MSLPYFYEPAIIKSNSPFVLSEETSKHCIQVLRMKIGEGLHVTDGIGNVYTASIVSADKKNCAVIVDSANFQEPLKKRISIGISLLKNTSRFEWFLEKSTEIGVCEIIPLLCQRTEKQYFRFDRMQTILVSAMLQSKQSWLPVLQMPTVFRDVIQRSIHEQKLIAHCEENKKINLRELQIINDVQILIGPEGDFSTEEINSAINYKYQPISLGDTRLRTETAGVVAVNLLMNL